MDNFGFINVKKLGKLFKSLTSSEFKFLLLIVFYLNNKDTSVYVNNSESRAFLASMDFSRTPERISTLLSSLTKKGILKREFNGVYSAIENLCLSSATEH